MSIKPPSYAVLKFWLGLSRTLVQLRGGYALTNPDQIVSLRAT